MPARQKPLDPLVPAGVDNAEVDAGGKPVRLTNLRKPFWPDLGITKGDLLRYYAAVSPALLPHITSRAMTSGSKGVHVYVPITRGAARSPASTLFARRKSPASRPR